MKPKYALGATIWTSVTLILEENPRIKFNTPQLFTIVGVTDYKDTHSYLLQVPGTTETIVRVESEIIR